MFSVLFKLRKVPLYLFLFQHVEGPLFFMFMRRVPNVDNPWRCFSYIPWKHVFILSWFPAVLALPHVPRGWFLLCSAKLNSCVPWYGFLRNPLSPDCIIFLLRCWPRRCVTFLASVLHSLWSVLHGSSSSYDVTSYSQLFVRGIHSKCLPLVYLSSYSTPWHAGSIMLHVGLSISIYHSLALGTMMNLSL